MTIQETYQHVTCDESNGISTFFLLMNIVNVGLKVGQATNDHHIQLLEESWRNLKKTGLVHAKDIVQCYTGIDPAGITHG